MKKYESPEILIERFEVEDVITASSQDPIDTPKTRDGDFTPVY